MDIVFYDVRTRTKVSIPLEQVRKYRIVRKSGGKELQVRYAVSSLHNGGKVTRFISKEDFEAYDVPRDEDKISEKPVSGR